MAEIRRHLCDLLAERIKLPLNFIQVLIGPRQVGKSTALEQVAGQWQGSKHFVSADGVVPPDYRWVEFHWKKARSLTPPVLLIFDEIQKVTGWSETIKVLFDQDRKARKLRIILSGSASLGLQHGLSESLTGRYEVIHAHHWSYSECHHAFNWCLDDYLKFGGYPAAAELIGEQKRWQSFMREGIIEPVFSRDIQTLINVQKPALLRQVFELAMKLPAQEISYQKLLGQLQDRGNAATIKHYLEILQGAFLVKILQKYNRRPLKAKSSSPKIIPGCPALIHAFTDPQTFEDDSEWRGHVFEAVVGAHLMQTSGELYYWREDKNEVDFVIGLDRQLFAIEVKSGRRKSTQGLIVFSEKYPKAQCVIIDLSNIELFLNAPSVDDFLLRYQRKF